MRRTLLACENPWAEEDGALVEWSMHPFLQGLSLSCRFYLLYRTFTVAEELKNLLTSDFPRGGGPGAFVYISSHGRGKRLHTGAVSGINLGRLALSTHRDLEAIWLSACEVSGSDNLFSFLRDGGAVWAGGYQGVVSWDAAMLIDIAVINAVMSSPVVSTKSGAVKLIARALSTFNPDWAVYRDDKGNTSRLRDVINLVARDEGRGPRMAIVTDELMEELGWSNEREKRSA